MPWWNEASTSPRHERTVRPQDPGRCPCNESEIGRTPDTDTMKTPGARSDHPSDEVLAAFLEGTLPAGERDAVASHLEQCASCRDELALAGSVLAELEQEAVEAAPSPGRDRWVRRWSMALVAAAAALLLLVPASRWLDGPPPDQRIERVGSFEGRTTLDAVAPVEGADVEAQEVRFVWRPSGTEAHYELTLTDAVGEVVWSVATSDTVAAPGDAVQLAPGTYYWVVDALLPDAREASTDVHRFVVTR